MKAEQVKELTELLRHLTEEKDNKVKVETFPLSPEGYDSLIPDEILKESIELYGKVTEFSDKCTELYIKSANLEEKMNPLQTFQMTMHMDCIAELKGASQRLAGIHEINVPMLTELAEESGAPSVDEYINHYLNMKANEAIMEMMKKFMH